MGFFEKFSSRSGQDAIDNGEQNTKNRLNYLRFAPPYDRNGRDYPTEALPASVCELPREIEYRINKIYYGLSYRVEDQFNYPYTYESVKRLLDSPDYYTESGDYIGTMMVKMQRRYPNLFEAYYRPGDESVIIPFTEQAITADELELPSEMTAILDLDKKESTSLLRSLIDSAADYQGTWKRIDYNFQNPGVSFYVGLTDLEPKYLVFFNVDIDLRINGIPADKYNLTYTERARLIRELKTLKTSGRIESDGKELCDDIPLAVWNKYEAQMQESRNFTRWYDTRQPGYVEDKRPRQSYMRR